MPGMRTQAHAALNAIYDGQAVRLGGNLICIERDLNETGLTKSESPSVATDGQSSGR
jgi:hypothetical protein